MAKTRAIASSARWPVAVDALAEPRDLGAAVELGRSRRRSTSAIEQARGVGADVDDADAHRVDGCYAAAGCGQRPARAAPARTLSTARSVIARPRAWRRASRCAGATSTFGAASSGWSGGSGSGSVTSSAAPAIVAGVQRGRTSAVGVDQRAAGGVDEDRGRLHPRERVGVDRGGASAAVSGTWSETKSARASSSRSGVAARLVVMRTSMPKPGRALRDRAADAARADDAQRRAGDVVAEEARRAPTAPTRRRGPPARSRGRRRAAASSSANARSAVASVRTSGVLPTGMPRARAAARSMLSVPTA